MKLGYAMQLKNRDNISTVTDGKDKYIKYVMLVIIAGFVVRIALLHSHPLYLDEGLYSEMIEEQLDKPSLVSTYLGFQTSWKPPLFFWVYAIPVAILKAVTHDVELIYRLPNIILGTINIWIVFTLFRKITNSERIAFYTALLYAFCPLTIYTDLRVLIDTFNATLLFTSFYFYIEGQTNKNIILGALFAFLAALTKSVVAFIIPLVVFAYYFAKKKITPHFLFSLLAAPLGVGIHYAILFLLVPNLAGPELGFDFVGRFTSENGLKNLGLSYTNTFSFLNMLLVFGLLGLLLFWKKNPYLTLWGAAVIIPLLGSSGMVWYFYPFVPILAYFSTSALLFDFSSKKEKYDAFFKEIIAFVLIFNIAVLYLWYGVIAQRLLAEERNIGTFLAGKENIAVIGNYGNTITLLTYKILNERLNDGRFNDFGWIITREPSIIVDFAKNYHTTKYPTNEDNFASLFWVKKIFRKPTNISSFDYIIVDIPNYNATSNISDSLEVEGYKKIMGNDWLLVFKKN